MIKTYAAAIVFAMVLVGMFIYEQSLGLRAFNITLSSFREMLAFLPPIFILVGLLDVWVPKETLIKFMGEDSGWKGILIAFLLGSAAAGPLYAAFPIAALLIKKGARLAYVLFFLGAWSSTKLPLVLFETASLGANFTLIHIGVSTVGFLMTAFIIEKMLPEDNKKELYLKAEAM